MLIEIFVSLYSILAMSKMTTKLTSQQRSFLRALGQKDDLTPRTAPSSPSTFSALERFQGQNRSRSRAATFRRAVGTPLPVSAEEREQAKGSLRLLHRKMKKTALDKKRHEVLMAHRVEKREETQRQILKKRAQLERKITKDGRASTTGDRAARKLQAMTTKEWADSLRSERGGRRRTRKRKRRMGRRKPRRHRTRRRKRRKITRRRRRR